MHLLDTSFQAILSSEFKSNAMQYNSCADTFFKTFVMIIISQIRIDCFFHTHIYQPYRKMRRRILILPGDFLRAFVLLFPPTNKTFDFFGCWNWLMQLYHDKKSKQSLSTKKASF